MSSDTFERESSLRELTIRLYVNRVNFREIIIYLSTRARGVCMYDRPDPIPTPRGRQLSSFHASTPFADGDEITTRPSHPSRFAASNIASATSTARNVTIVSASTSEPCPPVSASTVGPAPLRNAPCAPLEYAASMSSASGNAAPRTG